MGLFRTPSLKKSFSARTSGQLTRSIKRALIPGYGKKGMGWLHPERKVHNEIYRLCQWFCALSNFATWYELA